MIRLYEVGPRDGLQGLSKVLPVESRTEMVKLLYEAGIDDIEVGSMVNPNRLPTMAKSGEVYLALKDMQHRLEPQSEVQPQEPRKEYA